MEAPVGVRSSKQPATSAASSRMPRRQWRRELDAVREEHVPGGVPGSPRMPIAGERMPHSAGAPPHARGKKQTSRRHIRMSSSHNDVSALVGSRFGSSWRPNVGSAPQQCGNHRTPRSHHFGRRRGRVNRRRTLSAHRLGSYALRFALASPSSSLRIGHAPQCSRRARRRAHSVELSGVPMTQRAYSEPPAPELTCVASAG